MLKVALTIAVAAAIALPLHAQAPAPGLKIMEEMVRALGGPAFLAVREIKGAGRFYAFTKGELSSSDVFVDYIRLPDAERTELGKDKNRLIYINKGKEGWAIDVRGKKIDPQPVARVEEFLFDYQTSLEYVLRFVLGHPQTSIQRLGDEIINFNRADVVELRDPAKNLIRFYVSRDTHLPIKMQVRKNGKPNLREDTFSNWHTFGGVKTPLSVGHTRDGVKTMELHLDSVEYSTKMEDALFIPALPK